MYILILMPPNGFIRFAGFFHISRHTVVAAYTENKVYHANELLLTQHFQMKSNYVSHSAYAFMQLWVESFVYLTQCTLICYALYFENLISEAIFFPLLASPRKLVFTTIRGSCFLCSLADNVLCAIISIHLSRPILCGCGCAPNAD